MRYNGTTRKDVTLGEENKIPLARKFLGQLKSIYGKNSIQFRKILMPDGTTYVVTDYHNRKALRVIGDTKVEKCSTITDTGIYNVPPGILYIAAVPPTIEYKTQYFSDETALWFGNLNITKYIYSKQQESIEINFPSEMYLQSGDQINMSDIPGEEPDKHKVTVFNNIMHKWPASCWTGLTRLFMQSIYGAYREDLTAERTGENSWDIGNIVLDGYRIDYNFNIIKDDDTLTYWVAQVRNTSVNIYNLKLSSCSTTLLDWYRENKDTVDIDTVAKIEAYIFSGATIDSTSIVQTINFDAGAVGNPWYYGWKSNSNGSKFAIVTIVQDLDTYRYTSTLSEIALTYDADAIGETPETEPVNFSVKVLQNTSSQFFLTAGHDRIWTPDTHEGGMAMLVPHPFGKGAFISANDAALYCFYKTNDSLHVVPFTATYSSSTDAVDDGDAPASNFVCYNELTYDKNKGTVSGSYSEQTRGIGGLLNTNKSGHDSRSWWFELIHFCTGKRTNCQSGWGSPGGIGQAGCTNDFSYQQCGAHPPLPSDEGLWPTTTLRTRGDVGNWYWRTANDTGLSQSIQTMMIIPWHDAAAVYTMGYMHKTTTDSRTGFRKIRHAYVNDTYYGSWTQCDWPNDCIDEPYASITPNQCFPTITFSTEMWNCVALIGAEEGGLHECRCRPPGPCGGDGPMIEAQPTATRIDLMEAPIFDQLGATSNTFATSIMYNINGQTTVENDWHSLWEAAVYAHPFVSMPIKVKTSANYKLSMYNKNQSVLKSANPYQDSEYKFFIGWQ